MGPKMVPKSDFSYGVVVQDFSLGASWRLKPSKLRFGFGTDLAPFWGGLGSISGPFRGPEGSEAICAVLGAVRRRPGTGRFRKVRTEEFHRRSDVHTYKSKF